MARRRIAPEDCLLAAVVRSGTPEGDEILWAIVDDMTGLTEDPPPPAPPVERYRISTTLGDVRRWETGLGVDAEPSTDEARAMILDDHGAVVAWAEHLRRGAPPDAVVTIEPIRP